MTTEDSATSAMLEGDDPRATGRGARPIVQAEKLTKLYPVGGGLFGPEKLLHAVDDVSLYVRKRETLGLVGESGSGKSTLGRTLLRLSEPTFGRIHFDGQELTKLPDPELRALRRRMQIVFQDPHASLNPRMTLHEIVAEGLRIHRLAGTRSEEADRVAAMLEKVGLGRELMARYPHELSGGQRQRVGIARALVLRPDFVVCDEPVSALDVSVQAQIVNLLGALQDEMGVGYLFISHDLRVVEFVSHRIGVMYLGRIVEMGPAREVVRRRHHPYTRALYDALPSRGGHPTRKILPGEPPSAVDPPKGCVFHPRCDRAEKGRCDVERPPLVELTPKSHHRVACFHPITD